MSKHAPKLVLVAGDDHLSDRPIDPLRTETATATWVSDSVLMDANNDLESQTDLLSGDWYEWARDVAFGPLDGLDDVIEEARVDALHYLSWQLAPTGLVRCWSDEEADAAEDLAQQATRDRLLMAAAQVAHDNGTCAICFAKAALKAFDFTDPAAFEDED